MHQSLVDLRHSATHSDLPTESLLVEESEHALNWLEVNYWQAQCNKYKRKNSKLRERVVNYKIKATSALKKQKQTIEQMEIIDSIIKQCSRVNMIEDTIIPLFINDVGVFIPNNDILQSSIMSHWLIEHLKNQFSPDSPPPSSLHQFQGFPLITIEPPPNPLLYLWKPLLDQFAMNFPHFLSVLIPALVSLLYKNAEDEKIYSETLKKTQYSLSLPFSGENILILFRDIQNLMVLSWINYLITNYFPLSQKNKKSKSKKKKQKASSIPQMHPPFSLLWKQSMSQFSKWGRFLANLFSSYVASTQPDFPLLLQLNESIETAQLPKANKSSKKNNASDNSNSNSNSISLAEIESFLKVLFFYFIFNPPLLFVPYSSSPKPSGKSNIPWKLCDEWLDCPIGCLPSGFPDLTLPTHLDNLQHCKFLFCRQLRIPVLFTFSFSQFCRS